VSGGDPKIPYIFYIYLSAADSNPQLNPADYFQDKALPLLKAASQVYLLYSKVNKLFKQAFICTKNNGEREGDELKRLAGG
jgi:hypothetical protein